MSGESPSPKRRSQPAQAAGEPAFRSAPRGDLLAQLGNVVQVADLAHSRRVFVNRNLRMDEIDHIGFDMDYTLAIYHQRQIEQLSIQCTLEKLVAQRGYPEAIRGLEYDSTFAIRGLVVDRRCGNIFKMDRFGHVERVYHGSAKLDRDERVKLYRLQRIRLSSSRYAWIDTLFALPEAVMFARIIEWMEQRGETPRFGKLWQDIRDSIDEAHRDESMKRVIKSRLADYIVQDPELAPTLHKFRSAGKRLFLLTNSLWDYSEKVMSFLLDGQLDAYPSWRSYFDAVVVGASKPAFFTEKRPFVELDADGREKGAPFTRDSGGSILRGRVYQGGNVSDFDALLGGGGDRVLYIGDHIYGDMLRAKKSSVWRTAMVVQELEQEIDVAQRMAPQLRRLDLQERRRRRLESELNYQQLVLRSLSRLGSQSSAASPVPPGGGLDPAATLQRIDEATMEAARLEVRRRLDEIRGTLRDVGEEIGALDQQVDRAFNPFWGPLFKVGVENSRFGEQVEDYACVYTSRVSNFLSYSPLQYFRSPRDHMPHEL